MVTMYYILSYLIESPSLAHMPGGSVLMTILLWECVVIAIFFGLIAGILLSKAAELVLLNLLNMDITFTLSIGLVSLRQTPMIYGVIYLLLLFNSLIKVSRSKPLELMQSSKVGERIPKRNWLYVIRLLPTPIIPLSAEQRSNCLYSPEQRSNRI